jgi:hypothetical protein
LKRNEPGREVQIRNEIHKIKDAHLHLYQATKWMR